MICLVGKVTWRLNNKNNGANSFEINKV